MKAKYEKYKQNNTRIKNKIRKLKKYLKTNPNDQQTIEYLDKLYPKV